MFAYPKLEEKKEGNILFSLVESTSIYVTTASFEYHHNRNL